MSTNYLLTVGQRNLSALSSFESAKEKMKNVISVMNKSFYCECNMHFPLVETQTCKIKRDLKIWNKYSQIEFEHVLPSSVLKKKFKK